MRVRIASLFTLLCGGVLLIYAGQFLVLGYDRLSFLTEAVILSMVPVLSVLVVLRARRLTRPAILFASCLVGFVIMIWISTNLYGNPNLRGAIPFALDVFLDLKLHILSFLMLLALRPSMFPRLIDSLLTVLLIIALVNLPFVLRDFFLGGVSVNGAPIDTRGGMNVPVGIFDHKIRSSSFMLLGLIAALARCLESSGQGRRIYGILALVFFATTIVHVSVKEMVGALIAVMLYAGLFIRNIQSRTLLGILVLPAAVTAILTTSNPITTGIADRFEMFVGEGGENTVRTRSYVGAVEIAQDKFPFGAGAATFMSRGAREAYSPYYYTTGIAFLYGGNEQDGRFLMDTFWPKIFGQAGFIGGGLYLFAMLFACVLALRMAHSNKSRASFFATSTLITFCLASLATPVFTHDYLVPVLALALAYTLAQPRRVVAEKTAQRWDAQTSFNRRSLARIHLPNEAT